MRRCIRHIVCNCPGRGFAQAPNDPPIQTRCHTDSHRYKNYASPKNKRHQIRPLQKSSGPPTPAVSYARNHRSETKPNLAHPYSNANLARVGLRVSARFAATQTCESRPVAAPTIKNARAPVSASRQSYRAANCTNPAGPKCDNPRNKKNARKTSWRVLP